MKKSFKLPRKIIFVLIDSRIGFMPIDIDAINLIEKFDKPISIVFTKIDKLSKTELENLKQQNSEVIKNIKDVYYTSSKDVKSGDLKKLYNLLTKNY